MIGIHTGKTGSGKTFSMINDAYKEWLKGADIYTNTLLFFTKYGGQCDCNINDDRDHFTYFERLLAKISYNYCKLLKKDYKTPRRGKIIYFEHVHDIIGIKNAIILLDEAQVLLNSRNWESLPEEISYKLQQHRKHRLDLYCTAQNMGTVEINYRRLVQHWIHYQAIFEIKKPRSNRVLFGLYRKSWKDIDALWERNTEEIEVDDVKVRYFTIHIFKRRLYDTMYDIGFSRLKVLWIYQKLKNKKLSMKLLIVPKKSKLKEVLRDISTLRTTFKQERSSGSRRN